MAGIYFRSRRAAAARTRTLTGYFRLRGEVDVLGLISASIELYLDAHVRDATKKAVGQATLTIEVEIAFFSTSVDDQLREEVRRLEQRPDVRRPDGAAGPARRRARRGRGTSTARRSRRTEAMATETVILTAPAERLRTRAATPAVTVFVTPRLSTERRSES